MALEQIMDRQTQDDMEEMKTSIQDVVKFVLHKSGLLV